MAAPDLDTPFDPGLQPERVALSWQRTSLAIAVGSLFYARLVAHQLGLWALLPAVAGLGLGTWTGLKAHLRYRHHHRVLNSGEGLLADGLLPAIVAACVGAAGIFALVVMLAGH